MARGEKVTHFKYIEMQPDSGVTQMQVSLQTTRCLRQNIHEGFYEKGLEKMKEVLPKEGENLIIKQTDAPNQVHINDAYNGRPLRLTEEGLAAEGDFFGKGIEAAPDVMIVPPTPEPVITIPGLESGISLTGGSVPGPSGPSISIGPAP